MCELYLTKYSVNQRNSSCHNQNKFKSMLKLKYITIYLNISHHTHFGSKEILLYLVLKLTVSKRKELQMSKKIKDLSQSSTGKFDVLILAFLLEGALNYGKSQYKYLGSLIIICC